MRKAGASYSVVIPKALLEILEINPEKHLVKIDLKDDKIILTKGREYFD